MVRKISFFLLFTLCVSSLYAADSKQPAPIQDRNTGASASMGKIEQVDTHSMAVRVGDATTRYTFDNKTVFTYGNHRTTSERLKRGDEVYVRAATKGKAQIVNVTEQIEGVVEKINLKDKTLSIKVGDEVKEIPFSYFLLTTPGGNAAAFEDMKAGDGVLLNVNMGYAGKHKP
jgi:preprotein translocase subunit YajC